MTGSEIKRYKMALAISMEYEERCKDMSYEEFEFEDMGLELRRWYADLMFHAIKSAVCSNVTAEEIQSLVDKHNPKTTREMMEEFRRNE